tara:strand:+ start:1064 stop:1231 length:168 start_codon:yes stop_codon:yes gene_type:complete
MFEIIVASIIVLIIRNRILHAHHQRQKEALWREVIHKVEQKRKLDELYGRDHETW